MEIRFNGMKTGALGYVVTQLLSAIFHVIHFTSVYITFIVVLYGSRWEGGEVGEGDKVGQTSNYKII